MSRLIRLLPRQRGSAMIEFAWAAPVLTVLGLAVLQYAMLFFAKNGIDHASFMAARAGATGNASLASVQSAYVRALVPVYGGGRNAEELAQSHARAAADLAGNLRIELLNPTRESFGDWNDPALQQSVGQGRRVIPNGNLAFKNAADIKSRSGQNIQDANLIKLRITQGYQPKVPLLGKIYTEYLRKWDPHTDAFHTQLVAAGRIPVVTHVTMQMQSDAIESEQAASMPGPGNDSTPSPPGDTPVADGPPAECVSSGCIAGSAPEDSEVDSDVDSEADPGGSDPPMCASAATPKDLPIVAMRRQVSEPALQDTMRIGIVTGPSLIRCTFIIAPNSPVETTGCSARARSTTLS